MTYGDVAKIIGANKGGKKVGWALHANKDPNIPCHRVVFADGSLAAGYVFGGEEKQREKLRAEGVEFTDEGKANLESCRL